MENQEIKWSLVIIVYKNFKYNFNNNIARNFIIVAFPTGSQKLNVKSNQQGKASG
jgi:hypothetical protein